MKADLVLQRLAEGLSLRKAAEAADTSAQSVLRWKAADEAFAEQYARARETGYLLRADEIYDIANTPMIGEVRTVKPDGSEEIKYADMIEHRRFMVDARKWELSKMLPKVFGDKVEVSHVGSLAAALASLNGTDTPAAD